MKEKIAKTTNLSGFASGIWDKVVLESIEHPNVLMQHMVGRSKPPTKRQRLWRWLTKRRSVGLWITYKLMNRYDIREGYYD